MGDRRGNKPQRREGKSSVVQSPAAQDARDTGSETPHYCLSCQQRGYTVAELDNDGRLAFLQALHDRRTLTWNELLRAPHHGLGTEWLPARQLRASLPAGFADREKVLVFRYRGKLPMAGVRVDRVFHVLFIERHFGELYDHGS